jgi:hypothetical protein
MFETPILDRETRVEWEEEGRQVAQEDFETTISTLTEMYFEDECASCMEDILVEYLRARGYQVITPYIQKLNVFDYNKIKEAIKNKELHLK